MLMEQANKLASMLKIHNFSCSRSWIQRWRERHGIIYGKIQGEAGDVNLEIYDDRVNNAWPEIRMGYDDNDIFNRDEAGLLHRLTPDAIHYSRRKHV